MKQCRTENFREKDVINISDGKRLGCVSEVEFDICSGKITAIVVKGEGGFFSKGKHDIVIPWCHIEKIGEDIILVHADGCFDKGNKRDKCDDECCGKGSV